jgi:hypothetical protein
MDKDRWMRRALWCTAFFNLGGALLFAFPSSFAGHVVGLPPDVPSIYRALLAMFVVLFAGAYAWLAVQEEIDRPLVAFSAIGKAIAVLTVSVFWLSGLLPGRGVLAVSGDLVFASIFARWLSVNVES